MTIFDFSRDGAADRWFSIGDPVMGGVSTGRIASTGAGTAVFAGTVSLARNGGFASVRTPLRAGDLDGANGLALRVRGDGGRYKINLRTDSGFDGVLIDDEARLDPAELWRQLARHRLERLFLPFVALHELAEAARASSETPTALADVITAGEQLQITPSVRRFFERIPGCTLHNQYGPSETHIVTAHTLPPDPSGWPSLPSIGRPIASRVSGGARPEALIRCAAARASANASHPFASHTAEPERVAHGT